MSLIITLIYKWAQSVEWKLLSCGGGGADVAARLMLS